MHNGIEDTTVSHYRWVLMRIIVYVKCVFSECDKGVRRPTKLFVQEIVWYGNSTSVSRDYNVRESCCLPGMLNASGTIQVDHIFMIIWTIKICTCWRHGCYEQNNCTVKIPCSKHLFKILNKNSAFRIWRTTKIQQRIAN